MCSELWHPLAHGLIMTDLPHALSGLDQEQRPPGITESPPKQGFRSGVGRDRTEPASRRPHSDIGLQVRGRHVGFYEQPARCRACYCFRAPRVAADIHVVVVAEVDVEVAFR